MTNWIHGRINWYDAESGHGSLISDDNVWYRVHEFVNMPGNEPGRRVQWALAPSSIHPIVELCINEQGS